jgi:hypothetical protein
MLSENKEAFLSLVRLGIGTGTESVQSSKFNVQAPIDWNALEDLAARQGLSAVVAHDETGSGVMQYYYR